MRTQDQQDQQDQQDRRRALRNQSRVDLPAERRAVLPFPNLDALTPVEKPSSAERVLWRLAAFYDVVRDGMGRERYPHPLGVWLNPADASRLRRWVEAPLRIHGKVGRAPGRRSRLGLYWADKGPASSDLVPPGQIIVTACAYAHDVDGERDVGVSRAARTDPRTDR